MLFLLHIVEKLHPNTHFRMNMLLKIGIYKSSSCVNLCMVKYCPKCGKENNDEAQFCVQCGERLTDQVRYVKRREAAWGAGRIILVILGAIILLASIGLVAGGLSLQAIQESVTNSEGYIMSDFKQVSTNTYAIVVENIDINIVEPEDPFGRGITRSIGRDLANFATFKVTAESNNGKPVFVGIASINDVAPYLSNVDYDRAVIGEWNYDPWNPNFPSYDLDNHPGAAPGTVPTIYSYWSALDSGESATMTWGLTPGNYWLVIMNEDASEGVNVDMQVGAKISILGTLSNIMLSVGIILGLIGAVMIYYGAIHR
jgi:hypothetical protein